MKNLLRVAALVSPLLIVFCGGKAVEVPSSSDAGVGNDAASSSDSGFSDLASCTQNSECIITAPGCCGIGCGGSSASNLIAIRSDQQAALIARTCAGPAECPACGTLIDPNLHAVCESNKCTLIDVRTAAVSKCDTDEDCIIRSGGCCDVCGIAHSYDVVAINGSAGAAASQILCPKDNVGCPDCSTSYAALKVQCTPNGHCAVYDVK